MKTRTFSLIALFVALPACGAPDFSAIEDRELRKQTFVSYLCPIIERVNAEQLRIRNAAKRGDLLMRKQIATAYGLSLNVDESTLLERILNRVDAIHPRLVLAQAALESGWGTSNLAVKANNPFGRRCFYSDECVEVGSVTYRDYSSYESAVRQYYKDLNVLLPYKRFRDRRRAFPADPVKQAIGLASYSTKGDGYVRQLRQMLADETINCKNTP